MRLGTSRSNFLSILLVLSAAAGCTGSPPMAPTPATASAGRAPQPGPNIGVRLEGRVIDGDSNEPLAGCGLAPNPFALQAHVFPSRTQRRTCSPAIRGASR
jgi:hypothetical protein